MLSGLRSGDSAVVMTTEQMWSILSDYISYLSEHNQTASGKIQTRELAEQSHVRVPVHLLVALF